MPELLPTGIVLVLVVLAWAYLRWVVVDADELKIPSPELRQPVAAPGPARAPEAVGLGESSAPSPPNPDSFRPELAPAPDTIAAVDPSGSDLQTETAGLLRILEDGPDFQRQAAAKALAIVLAGSNEGPVLEALAQVVGRSDCAESARAESYCALREVAGDPLSLEAETRLRQDVVAEVDWDWIAACLSPLDSEDPVS